MKDQRPVFFNLTKIQLPVGAFTSNTYLDLNNGFDSLWKYGGNQSLATL